MKISLTEDNFQQFLKTDRIPRDTQVCEHGGSLVDQTRMKLKIIFVNFSELSLEKRKSIKQSLRLLEKFSKEEREKILKADIPFRSPGYLAQKLKELENFKLIDQYKDM